MPHAGCVYVLHGHKIVFRSTVVDQSGNPVPGAAVVVSAGDRILYDGAADESGVIAFSHVFPCSRHRGLRPPETLGEPELTLTLRFETRDGMVEVPVQFSHDTRSIVLGEIRLIGGGHTHRDENPG